MGNLFFFDKVDLKSSNHAIALEKPEQWQFIILSVLLESAKNCNEQGWISDKDYKEIHRLGPVIKNPDSDLKQDIESALKARIDGGNLEAVYGAYFELLRPCIDAGFKAQTPKELILEIIKYLRNKSPPYGKTLMQNWIHAFVLDPNQSLLQEAITSEKSAEEWLKENMEAIIPFASTNWEDSNGNATYFAIKWNPSPPRVYELVIVNDMGKIQPRVDELGRATDRMSPEKWIGGKIRVSLSTGAEDGFRRERARGLSVE